MRGKSNATEPKPREYWREIPGCGGLYQASSEGRIRRVMPDGKHRQVKIVPDCGTTSKQYVANLYVDGRRIQRTVLRLVALAFFPADRVVGSIVVHRNGLHSDNSAWNVKLLTPSENGRNHGGSRRRTVCMVDSAGAVIEFFPSIRAACAATGLAKQTIYRHCDNRKNRGLPGGISFRWDRGE